MGRHLADLAEMIAHLLAPPCQRARPRIVMALGRLQHASVVVAFEAIALSHWLDALAARLAPPVHADPPPATDPRINVARGGSC